jgi:hypothetical protein
VLAEESPAPKRGLSGPAEQAGLPSDVVRRTDEGPPGRLLLPGDRTPAGPASRTGSKGGNLETWAPFDRARRVDQTAYAERATRLSHPVFCAPPPSPATMRRSSANASHARARRDRTWGRVRWCEESVISSSSGLAKRIERRSLEPLAATRTAEPRTLKANTRFSPTAFHVIAFSPLHAALLDLEDVHSAASLTDNDEPAIE